MSDILGVTESCAKPNLRCLMLIERMRKEECLRTYLCLMSTFWILSYMPCLGSPCTLLDLRSTRSLRHLLSLQDFLLRY